MDIKEIKRLIKPYKQGYVAEKIGLTQGWLSQVLRGHVPMTRKTKRNIERFLKEQKIKP